MLFELRAPAENDRGPLYMEQALAALHHVSGRRRAIDFVLARSGRGIGLFVRCGQALAPAIERQLLGCYPDVQIVRRGDDALEVPDGHQAWCLEPAILPEFFAIRTYRSYQDELNRLTADPLMSLLATLPGPEDACDGRIEIVARPATERAKRRARYFLRALERPVFVRHPRLARLIARLASSHRPLVRLLLAVLLRSAHRTAERTHAASPEIDEFRRSETKLTEPLYEVSFRLVVSAPTDAAVDPESRLAQMAGALAAFVPGPIGALRRGRLLRKGPSIRPPSCLLSAAELATLFHLPTTPVRTEALSRVAFKELEPPTNLPALRDDAAVLGVTAFRGRDRKVGILPDDRLRHLAVFGKTGMGKSTLLRNLILSDIQAGRAVCCIDPHGDLADELLSLVPTRRSNDVIVFDAGDVAYPIAFNPLAVSANVEPALVASGVLSAFKKLYGESWGPRMEHILRNALLTLLDVPASSLASILPLLTDSAFRRQAIMHVTDPIVRGFWRREFDSMPTRLRAEAISPVLNKVGHFITHPILRNIIGQPQAKLDPRAVLDGQRVLIVNLAKGRVGDDASTLLGSLLITALQLAAVGRADMPAAKRTPFFLYVDEAHSFATEAFGAILSEGRKYGLAFGALATQFLEQFDEVTLAAIAGNVGTHIAFQVGQHDAEILAAELGSEVSPEDLMKAPKYHAYARLLIDGHPSQPFSMRTLPPSRPSGRLQHTKTLRRTSRHRYAVKRSLAEERVQRITAVA